MIMSCASQTPGNSSFAFQHNYLFKAGRHLECHDTPTLGSDTHNSPASLLCPPGIVMCGDLSPLKMWHGRQKFQGSTEFGKRIFEAQRPNLPLTSPPPMWKTSPCIGGAQSMTSLLSGAGTPPFVSAPSSSCWAMSREPSGIVFQSCPSGM